MDQLDRHGLQENAIIDIGQYMALTENEETVLEGRSASAVSTLRVTLSNPSFVATMMKMLAESSNASIKSLRVFFRVAKAGAISDGMSKREVEVLNDMTFSRGAGSSPVFNAKHFSTFRVPPSDIVKILEDAKSYASQFELVAPRPKRADVDTFGWDATAVDKNKDEQWNAVSKACHKHSLELIDLANRVFVGITSLAVYPDRHPIADVCAIVWPAAAPTSSYSAATEATVPFHPAMLAGGYATMQQIKRSSQPVVLKATSKADSERRSKSPGGRYLGPQNSSMREMQLFPDYVREEIVPSIQRIVDDRARVDVPDICQCETPGVPGGQAMGIQQQSSSSIDHTSSGSISRPPWVCCPHGMPSPLLDSWYDTMVDMGCDECSRMSLVLLAQYSPTGYALAHRLMYKLTRSRLEPIRHGSAFLAAGVESARRQLNPEGETLYGGLGGQDRRRV